jgi:hypothetical protein
MLFAAVYKRPLKEGLRLLLFAFGFGLEGFGGLGFLGALA